jgi:hypothetical protein
MGYFDDIARMQFRWSDDGRRLFVPGILWSRRWIVPDAETEERLFEHAVWINRVLPGVVALVYVLFTIVADGFAHSAFRVTVLLVAIVGLRWVIGVVVLRPDLARLERMSGRDGLRSYMANMAEAQSAARLTFGLVFLLAGTGGMVLMIVYNKGPQFIFGLGAACGVVGSVESAWVLWLKVARRGLRRCG